MTICRQTVTFATVSSSALCRTIVVDFEGESMAEIVSIAKRSQSNLTTALRSYSEIYAESKSLRHKCPRDLHAEWRAPQDLPDPLHLLKESSKGRIRQLLRNRYGRMTYGAALAIFTFLFSPAYSPAQLQKLVTPPAAKAEPVVPTDPLGRETPRSTLISLLKYEERGDYETAALFLQPTPGQANLTQLAKELHALHGKFKGNIGLLSDDPNGTVESGLPPGQVRAGVLRIGDISADFILVRVDNPGSGKIWLVSKETVADIPKLYAESQSEAPTLADRAIPAALTRRRVLGMSMLQWIEWLLSIPLSLLLAWLLMFLLTSPERIRCRFRKLPFKTIWQTRHGSPLKYFLAISVHGILVYLIGPPLLYRVYYFRLLAVLLAGCFAWLMSTVTDRSFEAAVNRARIQHNGGESMLILLQRLTRIGLLIIATLVTLSLFGVDVRTALAGLGIGGLAIVLGAQKTLENLIGGISLLMDKAVRVGDVCRIGDQVGKVEDIGLRSLKLRTLDQNLLVVPNGSLAQMEFQNLTRRSKLLINQTFSLRIETQANQLRFVLDRIQALLDANPAIESGTSRIRVTNFVGAAFQFELFAYGMTGDWPQLTLIRQDLIIKIAEIVEGAGTRFAAPTQLAYLSTDKGIDAEKVNDNESHITELRTTDVFTFPGPARTGTE
jgi:MscS family membrane protein